MSETLPGCSIEVQNTKIGLIHLANLDEHILTDHSASLSNDEIRDGFDRLVPEFDSPVHIGRLALTKHVKFIDGHIQVIHSFIKRPEGKLKRFAQASYSRIYLDWGSLAPLTIGEGHLERTCLSNNGLQILDLQPLNGENATFIQLARIGLDRI